MSNLANPRFLTSSEVAAKFGVSRKQVCVWARQGIFPGALKTLGTDHGWWRIPEADVRALLQNPAR